MSIARSLRRAAGALTLLCLASLVCSAENAEPARKPEQLFKLPEGAARAGWELLLQNKFAEATAAFRDVLKNDARDLAALEGLRAALVSSGDYKEAQKVNLQMVAATDDPALLNVFATRAIDALGYVESRAAIQQTFTQAAAGAAPPKAALLKDFLATLYLRMDKPDEARQALIGLGYVDQWQFVAGPFGAKDKNNPFEKRFAPERSLKSLAFTDEAGKPIPLRKAVPVPHRSLDVATLMHGGDGVFYAFTNLDSARDQDVLLGVSAPAPYRVFLRGLPVVQQPGEEQYRRAGGELVRTRLKAGANPLLVKFASSGALTVRVMAPDYAPAPEVQVRALTEQELATHEASTARGLLFSQPAPGAIAESFLKRFTPAERQAGQGLNTLAAGGALTLAEAAWLDFAAQRENDLHARATLARTLAATAPDAVSTLDLAAHILSAAGSGMNNTEAREAEEARRLREHALALVPDSHQHLLALYYFFSERQLADQAFEKIRACATAHPDSTIALSELARAYQHKQFMVEAEQCLEKAATLDDACLDRLVSFHEHNGNRVRARELRRKEIQLGLLEPDAQFENAINEGDLVSAERLLLLQERAYPDRATEWAAKKVRLAIQKGDLKEAYKLEEKTYESQAATDSGRRDTLLSLVDLGIRLSKEDKVKELLRAYLKETPGDYELRRRLRGLEGEDVARWWEPYDVKVAAIDTSQFTDQKYTTANHAWIVDFMVTRVLPDLSRESYVHIAQKVLNLKGINELSEVLVQAQRNEIVFIRTLNPDGSSYEPQNVHNFNLAQSASLYKVGPGSILEHAYLDHQDADKDEPSLNMGFNFNAIDAPRAVSRWVVLIADEAKAKLDIRKICPDMVDEKILPGPKGYTVYQWTNKQVEGIKYEPMMPTDGDQEVIPLVLVETAERPYRANRWLMRRERDFIPQEAVAEAMQLVAGKTDDAAKFEAIVKWVRDKIQPGNDSHTLDDVWFSRAGNTGQMTTLAREMAQAVGLKVSSAYVNAAYQPGRVWRSKNAKHQWQPDQFANFGSGGQMLVLEQPFGSDRWAQFVGRTPKYYDPFEQNGNLSGALALLSGDDGARLKRLRGEEMGQAPVSHRMKIELDAEGAARIKGVLQLYGAFSGNVREGLSDPRQKPKIKEWVVRNAWPKIESPEVAMQGEANPEGPISFLYTGSVKNMANRADGNFFLQPFTTRARLLDLRGPAERQHDLLVKNEFADLDHTLTYICPEGYAWVEVPDDLFIVTEFGFFISDYNVKGRTLTCTRSFLMPSQRVPPDKYPQLNEFLKHIADDQQQRIAYANLQAQDFGGNMQEVYSAGYSGCGEDK